MAPAYFAQLGILRETGTPGFIHSKGRLPRKYDPTHVRASRTLGRMKSSWWAMLMQITPPQKPLVTRPPSGEVQGIKRDKGSGINSVRLTSCFLDERVGGEHSFPNSRRIIGVSRHAASGTLKP